MPQGLAGARLRWAVAVFSFVLLTGLGHVSWAHRYQLESASFDHYWVEVRADALAGKVMELRYGVTSDVSVQHGGPATQNKL